MSGRTHAAYVNYFQNGRKAHRLAEVERQLAAETSHQQEKRQLEAEARSADVIFRRRLHQLTGRNARCAGDS
ncbi:Uncharacterised protein [Enterobacter hormaechei]|nr:Uncharacterised protein [Enterobacter hormaechei]